MPVGMDCETESLEFGPPPYVVALYDTRDTRGVAFLREDGDPTAHVLRSLDAMEHSRELCTFNGTAFDFRMLASCLEGDADRKRCARLALEHVDIMLAFAASTGYFSSLESFATATLSRSKIGSGKDVAEQWEGGGRQQVADYCIDDAKITAMLYDHGKSYGRLSRSVRSRPGATATWALPPSSGGPPLCVCRTRQGQRSCATRQM